MAEVEHCWFRHAVDLSPRSTNPSHEATISSARASLQQKEKKVIMIKLAVNATLDGFKTLKH